MGQLKFIFRMKHRPTIMGSEKCADLAIYNYNRGFFNMPYPIVLNIQPSVGVLKFGSEQNSQIMHLVYCNKNKQHFCTLFKFILHIDHVTISPLPDFLYYFLFFTQYGSRSLDKM